MMNTNQSREKVRQKTPLEKIEGFISRTDGAGNADKIRLFRRIMFGKDDQTPEEEARNGIWRRRSTTEVCHE
jgi:hypothetical protein